MKSSTQWAKGIRAGVRIAIVLVLAAIFAGTSMTPVFAHDNKGPRGYYRGHQRWHRPPGRYYRPAPVYVAPPPPVVYAPPPPPPGINVVFPIHIR